ncbi:hypothetical protein HDV01_002894 [Terramyces sp. JEL0728]|nr:hypothetical protein HDV01_002894 [Terramyces sp. JEL0728]
MIATLISILGNLLYAYAGHMKPSVAPFMVILSRFVVGFGSGTLGVTRSFITEISLEKDKLQNINRSVFSQYSGFTLSPLISEAILFYTTNTSIKHNAALHGLTMCVLYLLVLILLFKLPPQDDFCKSSCFTIETGDEEKLGMIQATPHKSDPTVCKEFAISEYYCFILFILINFLLRGILGAMETTLSSTFFSLSGNVKTEIAVMACNRFFIGIGLFGMAIFYFIPGIVESISAFNTLLVGILSFSVGSLLTSPLIDNQSVVLFVVASVLIWSVGSPIAQTLTISSFSKMIGSKPSPLAMGWLTTAGSLGRIALPLLAGANQTISSIVILVCCFLILVGITVFKMHHLK